MDYAAGRYRKAGSLLAIPIGYQLTQGGHMPYFRIENWSQFEVQPKNKGRGLYERPLQWVAFPTDCDGFNKLSRFAGDDTLAAWGLYARMVCHAGYKHRNRRDGTVWADKFDNTPPASVDDMLWIARLKSTDEVMRLCKLLEQAGLCQMGTNGNQWEPTGTYVCNVCDVMSCDVDRVEQDEKIAQMRADIESIYQLYPRKIGKVAAVRAIGRAIARVSKSDTLKAEMNPESSMALSLTTSLAVGYMKDRVTKYANAVSTWPDDDKKYIPHPATWFNQGRYDDDPATWERSNVSNPKFPATPKLLSKEAFLAKHNGGGQ